MNGQEFYEYYYQRISNAKTPSELSDIQKEILDFAMESCEKRNYSEYAPYITPLLSFFNNQAVNTVTDEVRGKHRR